MKMVGNHCDKGLTIDKILYNLMYFNRDKIHDIIK